MAKKMYYSEDETANVLKCTVDQLTNYAREGKLQQYQDGDRKVYRAEQVDDLANQLAMDDTGEIELTPADTAAGDAVSLQEADATKEADKEDTVITAEGVSIFDDEDLEMEAADPMAKTQIAPSLEDQLSGDGVGSGSGLLDLTRESDDTSLGAEVLGNIDMESSIGTGIAAAVPPEELTIEAPALAEGPAVAVGVSVVEAIDPSSGLFSGLIVGSAILAMLLALVMFSSMARRASGIVEAFKDNMAVVVGVTALIVMASGIVGLMLGKSIAARQAAVRNMGV